VLRDSYRPIRFQVRAELLAKLTHSNFFSFHWLVARC
jgi:hypothetical protein